MGISLFSSVDADSPATSEETDETASEHDPYDTVVVYQNHSPPPGICDTHIDDMGKSTGKTKPVIDKLHVVCYEDPIFVAGC